MLARRRLSEVTTPRTLLRSVSPARTTMMTPSTLEAIWRGSEKPSKGGASKMTKS